MLKRLMEKKSAYNFDQWKTERKKQVDTVKRLCKYNPSITTREAFNRRKSWTRGTSRG